MPGPKPLVLFIGHNAGRSGAPVLLLELIKEFKRQSDLPFAILLGKGGELVTEYEETGITWIWDLTMVHTDAGPVVRKISGTLHHFRQSLNRSRIRKMIKSARVLFINTIVNGDLLEQADLHGCRIITYVHELENAIAENTTARSLETILGRTDLFFVGSLAVKNNLVARHKVDPQKIELHYSSLPQLNRSRRDYSVQTGMFRAQNGIASDALVAGVAAGAEWRKGIDLFLPLVNLYGHLFPGDKIHFVWMGVKTNATHFGRLLMDYSRIKSIHKVHFLNHGRDYLPTMAAFDIHLLLSREDPFPLVVLDASTLGTPTVCFLDAGGAPEFVGTENGCCVPYGDLYEMARQVHRLATEPGFRQTLGDAARINVQKSFGQKEVVEKMITHINNLL